MARARKRKRLIGCLSAAGVLVLLSGLAIVAFFKFMDMLREVPPESTQVVLYNDTNERLQIDKILYGSEEVLKDKNRILKINEPGRNALSFVRQQPDMSRKISVWYTGLISGEQWRVDGVITRVPHRPCGFQVALRKGGGEVSS